MRATARVAPTERDMDIRSYEENTETVRVRGISKKFPSPSISRQVSSVPPRYNGAVREVSALKSAGKAAKLLQGGRLLSYGAWLVIPFALSKGQLGGLYAPWALAAVAVAGEDLRGLCALLGAAAGGWLFFSFQGALRHTACAVLIYAATLTFADSRLYLKSWFRPVITAFMLLAVQSVTLIGHGFPQWMLCFAAAAVAAAAAHQGTTGTSHTRTVWMILGFAAALLPLEFDHFSPGIVCGAWLVLLLSVDTSPAQAAAMGAGIGLVLDLVPTRPSLLLAAGFGLGAYLAAQCERRWCSAGCFCLAATAAALLFDADNVLPFTFALLTAGVAFLCVPKRFLPNTAGKSRLPGTVASPLRQKAAVFRELYEHLFRSPAPEKPENPSVLFDRAAEQVCRNCVLQTKCWQEGYNETYDAFNHACPHLLQRGSALPQDFPQIFSCRCIHFPELISAINRELYAYLLRRQYRLRLSGVKELAAVQVAQMGEALESSVETSAGLPQTVRLKSASALRPKENEKLCGDQVKQLSVGITEYFLLCDGMGSGESAHAEAAMTIRLLEQFLKAGIDPAPALKTLNTAMQLRCDENGAFPAVDLLALRKDTGQAALYKYGAAASYVKHHGAVTRYVSRSLPVGLQETGEIPEVQTLTLYNSDIAVLVSDGILLEGDEWLQNLLAGFSGDVHTLVSRILRESELHGGKADDCAVIAAQVENIPEKNARHV